MSPRSSRIGSRARTNFSMEAALDIYVRATEATDAPAIQNLVSHLTEELFGPFNVLSVIEKSLFAVTLVDLNDEVVGFAAFYDYPPVTAHVSPVDWSSVLNNELSLPEIHSLNTLFLHLFVTKADFAVGCAQEIVKSVFAAVPDVHQLLMCVPIGNHLDPAISDIFKPVNKTIKASSTLSATFFICHRYEISPVLHVRAAKMEDNDDLTPIFAAQNNQLQAVYGNYFVAELIDSQDQEHHALCAEKDGKAVGFMSFSTNVNLQLLNEAFELKPFHGLRKVHEADVLEPQRKHDDSLHEDLTEAGASAEEVLEATICLLAPPETNKSTFLSSVHVSNSEKSKMTKDNDGCIRLTVDLESFNKTIKLTFVELPEIDKENGLSSKQNAVIQSSVGLIFAYNASSASAMEDLMSDFSSLLLSKDPSDEVSTSAPDPDPIVPESEVAQTSADIVNSVTTEDVSLLAGTKSNKIKILLADLSDVQEPAENWRMPADIEELAAENGIGLAQAAFSNLEAVQDSLSTVLESVARTHFALQTPSLPDEDSDSKSTANQVKLPVQLVKPEPTFVPEYQGDSNCFCIQLFCIKEELETRSLDFMASAFQCYPDRDFCILTVPHMVPEFALLQNFVRVTPRLQSNLDQELYVFNRYGLLGDFSVRPSIGADYDEVEVLTKTIEGGDRILCDLKQYNEARRDKDGTPLHAFSACVEGGRVVGVAIVRQEENIEYLKSWYNIEDFIYYSHHQRNEHGHLHHFVLNPIFRHLTKTFIKEIMRLDSKSCLYYPIFPTSENSEEPKPETEQHTLITCLGEMAPIRPRRQIMYPVHMLHGNVPSTRVLKEIDPFALYSINRKLVLEPKIGINARIVVVGASTTSLGFLETLVFSPHLKFNNIMLVSPNGLPGDLPVSEEAQGLLSSSLSYPPEKLSRLSLRSWITVIQGTMIAIDRKSRRIHIRSSQNNQNEDEPDVPQILSYDHLILATGTQYEVPYPSGLCANRSDDELREEFPPPINAWTVNDEFDADHFLYYIKTTLLNSSGLGGYIIVYGSSVDAYCCLRVLLNCGIRGIKILFARKALEPNEPTSFNNPLIDNAIDCLLREETVTILDNCELYSWQVSDNNFVKEVSFRVKDEWINYACEAIICYGEKRVNYEAFRAINDSCLVFDSRVVIDADFHTNDVAIRAAGPVTKFSRKYHADEWSHANFYSAEVGHELALTMLKLFDPTLDVDEEEYSVKQTQKHQLIPLYQKPKIVYCTLPGEFHYLDVRKPNLPLSIKSARQLGNYGREYCTGTVNGDNPRYFMLHVNAYNSIQSLSCLSKEPIRCANLVCIYGRNEKLLNKLVSRFSEGLIKDFYSYFDEPWAMALFHDRFEDLMQEIRDIITNTPPVPGGDGSEDASSFAQRVRTIIEENMEMKPNELSKLLTDFQSSGYKQAVETRLLAYLSYNYYHLPMYAKPGMV